MANFCLCWPNRVTYGTITVSSAEPGLGGENLANDSGSPVYAWQTAGVTNGAINLVLPTQDTWRAFGLFRTNLTANAAVRWRVWAGTSMSDVPLFDSGQRSAGIAPSYLQSVLVLPSEVTGQMVQCDINDTGNPDGFLSVPLAYAGPIWQPLRNFDASSSTGRTSQSVKTATRGGGVVVRNDWTKRTFTLSLSGIRAAEVWSKVMDADLYARRGNNLLFIPDPADPLINLQSIFGEVEPTSEITYPNRVAEGRGWRATITERL